MGGGGAGDDMDNLRGASLPRCLVMEGGGGLDGGEEDKEDGGRVWAVAELWSLTDRSLSLSQMLSFSSFSASSDFFQRGPKARLSLEGAVL